MIQTSNKNFDLEERTALFGENIIKLCQTIKPTIVSKPLISQLIRSGTSIGANYMEANGASSRRDFANKISICKKEAQETMHWLRMLATAIPEKKDALHTYRQEAHELVMIFQKISTKLKH